MYSHSFLPNHASVRLTPQQIEARLAELIHESLSRRSTAMAGAITAHIKALCAHPDYRGSWEELCAYHKLSQQWGCLAWLDAVRNHPPARANNSKTALHVCN